MSEKGDKEEKGTRTGGTGSQGSQGPTGGDFGRNANVDRADPRDRASNDSGVNRGHKPEGPQGGGTGAPLGAGQGGGGVAVPGAFGRSPDHNDDQEMPGGDQTGHLGGPSGAGSASDRAGGHDKRP